MLAASWCMILSSNCMSSNCMSSNCMSSNCMLNEATASYGGVSLTAPEPKLFLSNVKLVISTNICQISHVSSTQCRARVKLHDCRLNVGRPMHKPSGSVHNLW